MLLKGLCHDIFNSVFVNKTTFKLNKTQNNSFFFLEQKKYQVIVLK